MIPTPMKGLFILIVSLWLSGCHTSKQMVNTSQSVFALKTTTDTSTRSDTFTVARDTRHSHELIVEDTAIGVPGVDLSFVFDDAEDTTLVKDNASLHVYKDSKGKRHADCKCDSITIAVVKVTRERDYYSRSLDSVSKMASKLVQHIETDTVSTTLKEVAVKENTGFWSKVKGFFRGLMWYLLAAVVGAVAWEIIKKLIRGGL